MAAKSMETINADDILYIKPRDGKLQESQLKASFEYNGGHGPSSFFVVAEVADRICKNPELAELHTVDTVKFEQKEDGNWQVVFSDNDMTKQISFLIETEEMNKICQRNHVQLVHV